MASRAMIVAAGGAATRFGGEKLLAEVAGRPLIAHTLEAVAPTADITVVAARAGLEGRIESLGFDVIVTTGGATRTLSELAALTALGREVDLIGAHDAARPLVKASMIETLFAMAAKQGGAVPTLDPRAPLVGRRRLEPVVGAVRAQTPQVFRGPDLLAAYVRAAKAGFDCHDTADVIQRFSDLDIASVEGDPDNIKVTYPEDLETVRSRLVAPTPPSPREAA